MKVEDPRLMSVEQVGEKVHVCICEPDREFPSAAELTGKEAEDLAIKLMSAGRFAQQDEYDLVVRDEEEILRKAEMIWRSRHPGKPYLAASA